MAQEIHILHWCDWCIQLNDEKTEAAPHPAVTRDGTVVDIDLCNEHAGLYEPFLNLAAVSSSTQPPPLRGKPRGAAANIPRDVPCPLCDQMFGTRAGVGGHFQDVHGAGIIQYEGWVGRKTNGKEVALWCPDCGAGFDRASAAAQHNKGQGHEEAVERRPQDFVYPESLRSLPRSPRPVS